MQQISWGASPTEVEAESLKKTPLKSLVTIVARKGILQEIVQSFES